MSVADLRARFLALHDARSVTQAEDAALFAAALEVYRLACERRQVALEGALAALDALREANETEAEWCAITHGRALAYAATIDRNLEGGTGGAHRWGGPLRSLFDDEPEL